VPFFWVHGQISNAFLPRYLGSDRPVYGFRHQGQEGDPARKITVEGIAEYYLQEVMSAQNKGPYCLGGYCFGGLVAFEMAQQLQQRGERVELLMLLEPANLRSSTKSVFIKPGAIDVTDDHLIAAEVQRHLRIVASLPAPERLSYVRERIVGKINDWVSKCCSPVKQSMRRATYKAYLRIGARIPLALRSLYILDVYSRAIKNYAPKPYAGKIVLFEGEKSFARQETWERLALGGLEVHKVKGRHEEILGQPFVQGWAEKLSRYLKPN
jgi:thioesterase domain-containing protein